MVDKRRNSRKEILIFFLETLDIKDYSHANFCQMHPCLIFPCIIPVHFVIFPFLEIDHVMVVRQECREP